MKFNIKFRYIFLGVLEPLQYIFFRNEAKNHTLHFFSEAVSVFHKDIFNKFS